MAVKKGLGKGLGNLIPEGEKNTASTKVVEKIVEKEVIVKEPAEIVLKINEVEPNREQPRRNFDEDSLLELSESIRQYGIIQPIIVKKREDYYEIVAGERRWRAAKMAGIKEVPVVIKDFSDREIMEVALIENIQREDLNPIEEALAYQRLIKEYDLRQDEVAERVSKSRVTITNSMRLLKLDERVQKMVIDSMLSSGHARALLSVEDGEKQFTLAMKIFDEKLSVRETERLVKIFDKPQTVKKVKVPEHDFIYRDAEEKLKASVGTKVVIKNKDNNKGKIEIEYYSKEDFERIVEMLSAR